MENTIFNFESRNYFLSFDSSRTDINFVHEWIESRFVISKADREDEAWYKFADYVEPTQLRNP